MQVVRITIRRNASELRQFGNNTIHECESVVPFIDIDHAPYLYTAGDGIVKHIVFNNN
jgi:hypothetical protein